MRRSLLIAFAALLVLPGARAAVHRTTANCSQTSEPMTPLTDLDAKAKYHGYHGGLYAKGANEPTGAYKQKGLTAAKQVHPIDGHIVLLSIGMSNTTQEFSAFKHYADANRAKAPNLTIVDGAQGGQDAEIVKDPQARFWSVVDQRLSSAGVTSAQVQAVWLKEAIAQENEPFPRDAPHLQADLRAIAGHPPGALPESRARLPLEPHVRRLCDHGAQSGAVRLRQRVCGQVARAPAREGQDRRPVARLGAVPLDERLAAAKTGLCGRAQMSAQTTARIHP